MTDDLTNSDAELAYKYMTDEARSFVGGPAFSTTLNQWSEDRPDDLDTLEAAHEDDSSPFDWIDLEVVSQRNRQDNSYEITHHTGAADATEEVYKLAHDFGRAYSRNALDRIREVQESTQFSPRAFVACVLSQRLTHREAANEMGIGTGTFSSKMSREVDPEIKDSRSTINFVDRLREE